ncbi:transcription antitermination factor NusB [Lacticaseibacillus hegangensis]|uniref:Transcription antitermination protein NusB n=1 Tax=Lacticaseibacillus hegangensis TaxID=2486010 RepID=A0ABW4CVV9_9LACO|nr:transcription antitermination factor NusB [Lacticaseibacillus hegangensis]
MLDRHDTRAAAFKALFAIASNADADRSAVYEEALPKDEEAPAYLTTLVDGVLAHQDELDAQINAKLKKGWTLQRLSKTDLILLRLGLFEIQQVPDVPDKVAVNEALELAKTYSDESDAKFINGILGHFVQA